MNTDIGYSRTWIRQALNDSLLSAYLTNIRRNTSALSPYYKRHAFLRDADKMEMAERMIAGGLESSTFVFALPTNSSLLNQWTYHPLQMAGLYTPPLRACPVSNFPYRYRKNIHYTNGSACIKRQKIIPSDTFLRVNEKQQLS